jgi:catalase
MQQLKDSLTGNPKDIHVLQISHYHKADPEYGSRIAEGLSVNIDEFQRKRFSPLNVLS